MVTLVASFLAVCVVQAAIAPHASWSANDGIQVFTGTALFSFLVALLAVWVAVVHG